MFLYWIVDSTLPQWWRAKLTNKEKKRVKFLYAKWIIHKTFWRELRLKYYFNHNQYRNNKNNLIYRWLLSIQFFILDELIHVHRIEFFISFWLKLLTNVDDVKEHLCGFWTTETKKSWSISLMVNRYLVAFGDTDQVQFVAHQRIV